MVEYSPGSYTTRANPDSGVYVTSRKYLPPVGWMSSSNYKVIPAGVQKTWPFYAKKIFAKMGPLERKDETPEKKTEPSSLSLKLKFLNELGFHDRDKNIETLRKHKFNLDECVSDMLDQTNN